MATARQSWQSRYRAARSAFKMWGDFERNHPSGDTPAFLLESIGACPLFKPTRLHGDVLGWFTDDHATPSRHGLFVPISPVRVADTRTGARLAAGSAVDVDPAGALGLSAADVGAVVVNLTATDATSAGYVQVLPTGQGAVGTSSNLNVQAGQTVANAAVAALGDGGRFTLFEQAGAQLVADVTGWFTA